MMRGVRHWAVAVRKPVPADLDEDGKIDPRSRVTRRHPRRDARAASRGRRVTGSCGCRSSAASSRSASPCASACAAWACPPRSPWARRTRSSTPLMWALLTVAGVTAGGDAVLPGAGRARQPDQGRAELGGAVLADRGRRRADHLPHLPDAHLASPRPAAPLRVPRGRAQDHRLLRGRGGAHPGQCRPLLTLPPPLRDELPADRDDRGDSRLRRDRHARLVPAASRCACSASR